MAFLEKVGACFDWILRISGVISLVGGLGIGTVIRAMLHQHTNIDPYWITPIWLLSSAAAMWILFHTISKHREKTQQQGLQAIEINDAASGIQEIKEWHGKLGGVSLSENERDMRAMVASFPTGSAREDILIKGLSVIVLMASFEVDWNDSYRSQLEALHDINSGKGSLTRQDIFPHYANAAKAYPRVYATYTFEKWIGWMRTKEFLAEKGDRLEITDKGQDFLRYLLMMGRSYKARVY